jgi:hypothetical protein
VLREQADELGEDEAVAEFLFDGEQAGRLPRPVTMPTRRSPLRQMA